MRILISATLLLSQVVATSALGAPTITVEGDPITVFDHSQRCEPMDLPDAPLRAFRRADGVVVALATHYLNRRLTGLTLQHLSRDCALVYQGMHLSDPTKFDDRTWISATWTSDGIRVIALGHNEYRADRRPGGCQSPGPGECLYDSIVPLISLNGGGTFARTNYPEPIAALPMFPGIKSNEPLGYHDPSNILFKDGYYYALIARSGFGGKPTGRCLFRTSNVESPEAWSVWDGSSFTLIFGSPYDPGWTSKPPCEAVRGLNGALGSIAKIWAHQYLCGVFHCRIVGKH